MFSCLFVCALLFCCLFLPCLGVTHSYLPWTYDTACITFLDVGQGDSVHIKVGNTNILVDGGGSSYKNVGESVLHPYLLKNGVTHVDLAIVTHTDMDHIKGIEELSCVMPIDKLYAPSVYASEKDAFSGIRCRDFSYVSSGDKIYLSDDVVLCVLYPKASSPLSEDNNENSLILRLAYKGINILLTGDTGMASEQAFMHDASCDILKVAHHGSAYSTGENFLRMASPSCAVISCGKNNVHGHPSLRVIELLQNSGIMTCRTDSFGAICIRLIREHAYQVENASKDQSYTLFRKDDR